MITLDIPLPFFLEVPLVSSHYIYFLFNISFLRIPNSHPIPFLITDKKGDVNLPRKARKKSSSGVYHVVFRGINRQTIFEDEEDKEKFLEILARYKTKSGIELYAYCLMDNHVHLLVKETEESLSMFMKRVSSSYVYWYNRKYRRCGHLFQERFNSENVESDAHLNHGDGSRDSILQ
ncbi:transposase [Bacillus sp. es.036]|uniref:transposase n=1 Tax=Bacillus sp. es.036 TaxID=1761764 RepID=UPI000C00F0F0|nr:transposase [Bacillus sp. es.036]PFG15085.1 REP element-mobilizing transposase RayT [Bacillus sp. es.036]